MYMKGLLRHKHDIIMQEPLEAHVEIPTNTKKTRKNQPSTGSHSQQKHMFWKQQERI